ncbi:MAG: hypothetical protein DHS20C07_13440 [Methyloligella sp.]|nr:MAG: hypothetical protein DHS20C07_13440 [Methyloligella sp.]
MNTVKMEAENLDLLNEDQLESSSGNHALAASNALNDESDEASQEGEEQLIGLIDPNKPSLSDDVVQEQDLAIARNLRRLEKHRYEIAAALSNINEEEIGTVNEAEEEIEISESDEKHAKHISHLQTKALSRRNERLNPDAKLEKIIDFLREQLAKVSTQLDLKSWDFMRRNLFLSWHQRRYDREIEQRLFNPLAKYRTMARSQTLREREEAAPCAPTKLVDWSLDCIASYQQGASFRHYVFVDPEAGHGRTVLLASHRDFRAIYGIESRGNWADDAAINIAQYPRTFMTQRQVELITSDFRLVEWPVAPLVVHIFNPQSSSWLMQVMENLSQSFGQTPRQIYLVIIANTHKSVMSAYPSFQEFSPPSSNLEQLTLMSPYEIDFYSSVIS